MSDIRLSEEELIDLTGYEHATKQLNVLRARGFYRAFINRKGEVVLERTHYEVVSRGQDVPAGKAPSANLGFLKRAA